MPNLDLELNRLNKDVNEINKLIKEMPLRSYFKRRFHGLANTDIMPSLSNLVLIVDPLNDDAGSVATTGQAITKIACTNLSDGSGWSLPNDTLSGIRVAGGNALIRSTTGYTFFVVMTIGISNAPKEVNIFTFPDRQNNSGGLWFEGTTPERKANFLFDQFTRVLPSIIAARENFFSPTSTGEFSDDAPPFDITVPHVFCGSYNRSVSGPTHGLSVYVDGIKHNLYPSYSGTDGSFVDGTIPNLLVDPHDNIAFGPHSGYQLTSYGPEDSPERLGSCWGYNVPLSDADVLQASTFIATHYPLLNT